MYWPTNAQVVFLLSIAGLIGWAVIEFSMWILSHVSWS